MNKVSSFFNTKNNEVEENILKLEYAKSHFTCGDLEIELGTKEDSQITTILGKLDKPLADKILKNMAHNRPISKFQLNKIKKDIIDGLWTITHQGIAFNEQEQCFDGQHRLTAVSETGIAVYTLMHFNCPDATNSKVDRMLARNISHIFHINKIKNAKNLSAVCRMIYIYKNTETKDINKKSINPDLAVKEYFDNKDDYDYALSFVRKRHKNSGISFISAVFLKAVTARINKCISNQFISLLLEETESNDSFQYAQEFFHSIKNKIYQSNSMQMHTIEIAFQCWNNYVKYLNSDDKDKVNNNKYQIDTSTIRPLPILEVPKISSIEL